MSLIPRDPLRPDRRRLLKVGMAAALMPLSGLQANTVSTRARVVILGGGAAGMSMANRLATRLSGARITVVEPREQHYYQPGWTMIASGLWEAERTVRPNADFRPAGIDWLSQSAVGIDADARRISLGDGNTLDYDVLVVATGLQLDYDRIDGMSTDLIGSHGIGSVYAGHHAAARTSDAIDAWLASGGGQGLFTMPQTAIKCAGAPIKMTFTTQSRIKKVGNRDDFALDYFTASDDMFSQPWSNDFLKQRFDRDSITRHHRRHLSAIDPQARQAEFTGRDGQTETRDFDFIHVVPPMSAPDFVKASDLIAQEGAFAGEWLDTDIYTMQHNRYPEVFGIGDVIGAPINKTAASVKAQAPVVEANIAAFLEDRPLPARHNGYTSCPLITAIGRAMLVEFGYDNDMAFLPSFAFIDPRDESWAAWVLKEFMLQPAYYAMLEGRV
ncbi:MAG: NAD(P)/FAD-dependent oxidoreductase [Thioalkalivibrio sp.]|nr:NAD(P)/FAD-dependent oxidoreductase [Thioalkalivibrio sp.]